MSVCKFSDKTLTNIFRKARHMFVFTGAGASKESGLPTFRDIDGEWRHYDPMTFATMDGFLHNPALVWSMYRNRQKQIAVAQPNPGHIALAQLEGYYEEFLLATQNVDDLHERAGSKRMVKIHGDAWQMKCLECDELYDVRNFDLPDEFHEDNLPTCPLCDSLCRPNIVWFGECLCLDTLTCSIEHAAHCDLMLIVGTSGEVSNGYGFAEYAHHNGAFVIDINPAASALTRYADCHIAEPAGVALPGIWKIMSGK